MFKYFIGVVLALVLATMAALAQQKVIKDRVEYNAYMAALKSPNPAQKGAAMIKFVATYPKSVVRSDALEQAMAAYQQAGDQQAAEKAAQSLIGIDKNNVQALAVAAVIERAKATQGDKQALTNMMLHAEHGLSALPHWQKPEGVSDADFKRLRAQMSGIFNGAVGFGALQAKNYAKARSAFLATVETDPDDLQNAYQLSVAELQATPLEPLGFWHIARAIAVAKAQKNVKALDSMDAYGRAKFTNYHHVACSFDLILAQASKQQNPPADFVKTIAPVVPPPAVAVQAVKECKPDEMSFDDVEYILGYRDASAANTDAAAQVWGSILSRQKNGTVRIQLEVKVVAANDTVIDAALTRDRQRANTADVRLAMAAPMAQVPATGATITVNGIFADYKPSPFMFLMTGARIAPAK
jgi:tetratricopeptide (TPR) repeat protein